MDPKVLEAIGAKKRSNNIKTDSPGINYQDSVSAPLSKEADDDAATQEGDDGDDEVDLAYDDPQAPLDLESEFILPAVDKERFVITIRFGLGS